MYEDNNQNNDNVVFEAEEELKSRKTAEKRSKVGKIEDWAYQLMPESYSLKRKRAILYLVAIGIFFLAFLIFVIR